MKFSKDIRKIYIDNEIDNAIKEYGVNKLAKQIGYSPSMISHIVLGRTCASYRLYTLIKRALNEQVDIDSLDYILSKSYEE